jgi:HK97 family phage portal protein
MSLVTQLFATNNKSTKFNPASAEVNWAHIETLVHGPGASSQKSGDTNSAVFACLMAIATSYPEPPLIVKRSYRSGDIAIRMDHPIQELLDNPTPNGELTIEDMLFWTAWAKHVDGNAYWLKVRSGDALTGNVVELWPISPTVIEPYTEKNSQNWIDYYKYRIRPNEVVAIPVQNVIHFRLGLDDKDMRKGLSPLKAAMREVSSDDEATKFTEALLKNYAIPGLVVIPTATTSLNEEDANRITAKLRQKFGNDNRGNIAVMSKETTVQQFGFSPEQLNMKDLHTLPEERISAVFGVAAVVAGLGAGLARSTFANFKEAREALTEQKLVPMWRSDARRLTASLLPDFTRTRQVFIEFDITSVRALQEDEDNKYTRLQKAVGKPWMTRNEARTDIGLDPVEGWDDEDLAMEPEPEPVPEQLQQLPTEGEEEIPELSPEDEPPSSKAIDLDKWRRKAIKSVKAGKGAVVKFDSRYISPVLMGAINGALETAQTPDDVQRVFANVWIGYP